MDTITISDLAVLCHIGVPDEERAKPQRLLITAVISGDFGRACTSDDLSDTVDYFRVCESIRQYCREHSVKLIERLAHELGGLVLRDTAAHSVSIEVKKFIIPETRHISCTVQRQRSS